MSQSPKKEAEDLYDRIRSKIEHEDELVNQRLMWMITLHGLLFTAYGFSLSAEATSLSAPGLVSTATGELRSAYADFLFTISTLRQAMVLVGIGSSFAALLGVVAACRAIRDDERTFKSLRGKLPSTVLSKPIGRRVTNVLGMACCLLVPFLGAGVWTWIGGLIPNPIIILMAVVLAMIVGLSLWPFLDDKDPKPGQGEGDVPNM